MNTFSQINHNENAIVLPPEACIPIVDVQVPPDVTNVPRPGSFVGRASALKTLDAIFARSSGLTVQVLHGLGGLGKSTLAAHWARTHCAGNPRWWITADSETAVNTGLADLARTLQPALAALPTEFLRERAVQWLTGHDDWLIVLDNVDRIDHIRPLLDRFTTGRFLITTRRATGWHTTDTLRLDVPDENEALDLFTRVLRRPNPRDIDGIAEVCAELGHLPLALEQAAAYCAETGVTPRAYHDMLARWPAQMYAAGPEGGSAERNIARVWRITLDRLTDTPLAGEVLRVLAWFAPDHIPRMLVNHLAPPPALAAAFGRLIAYSMITDNGDDTVSVHRLVQALSRTPAPDEYADPHRRSTEIARARDNAVTGLGHALPGNAQEPRARATSDGLLPHVHSFALHAQPDRDTRAATDVLGRSAALLRDRGQIALAIEYSERALSARTRILGPDHPDVLTSANDLALSYEAAGNLRWAIPLHENTLSAMARVLGEDHPHTLTSRNNLASAYQVAGNPGRAIALHERTLADRRRQLGGSHPDTLTSLNNLARAYQAAGDLGRAIPLYESTLSAIEQVLGKDHPYTLTSVDNLAGAYQAVGDTERAISLFASNLADRRRVLGDKHPDTLTARNNLGGAHQAAGDAERTIPLFESILADRRRLLGEDHPDTMAARNNLAAAHRSAGNPERAIPLYENNVTSAKRVLGEDHPHTLISLNNLGGAHLAAGDTRRAIALFESTLADRRRVLGEDHPHTLTSRNNLAAAYKAAGDLARAIPLYESTLTDMTRILGIDHPETRTVRKNLERAHAAE